MLVRVRESGSDKFEVFIANRVWHSNNLCFINDEGIPTYVVYNLKKITKDKNNIYL